MKVTVYKERLLKGDSKYWGSQHENFATTLFFDFPEYVEKNGEEIPTAGLNKYIVFDISRPDNQDVIKDGKYSFPHEITKLGTITFWVKLEEPSESEDMSDKLIWISKGLTVSFNKNTEGQIEITNEKLDTFNSLVTTLNLETKKVEDLVAGIETKLENGEFNGQDYVLTEEDKQEIVNTVKPMVEEDIQPILENIEDVAKQAEVIAKGANQALSYENYSTMILNFNAFEPEKFNIGQNIMIKTLNVPDLWVYEYADEKVEYAYTNDEDFVETLKSQGHVQVGYYKLGQLETQKVDLTHYIKDTDYASSSKAGVVVASSKLGTNVSQTNGLLSIVEATEEQIKEGTNKYNPITPNNLGCAVGSMFPVITQVEYDKLVAKGTVNENLYYCIVEEE